MQCSCVCEWNKANIFFIKKQKKEEANIKKKKTKQTCSCVYELTKQTCSCVPS